MTEQIKSTLEVLGTYDMSEDNDDTEFKDSIALAIRSLNAWSEVLQELEKEKDFYTSISREYARGMAIATSEAIDIINKNLSDVSNTNVGEIEEK